MKRARDIRDQLEGLLERVEIEVCSNASDLDAIKKAITSGTTLVLMTQLLYVCNLPELYKSDKGTCGLQVSSIIPHGCRRMVHIELLRTLRLSLYTLVQD